MNSCGSFLALSLRELVQQGYSILSPEYRGSTGYGRGFYEQIDYGGREVDDVHYGTLWMLDTYSFLDPKRGGMIGWSHGGGITLLNIIRHPETYAVGYAGVPVSDLTRGPRSGIADAASHPRQHQR